MRRFKGLLLAVISVGFALLSQAQHHNNAWFRGTVVFPVGSKLKADAEFQHRRQSGIGNSDMFERNLMYSFRTWLHFQPDKVLKLSLSPFAYFSNYRIIQKNGDEKTGSSQEIRFTAAAEVQQTLIGKLIFVDRAAAEYRIPEKSQSDIIRLRNRLGLRYDFTEKLRTGMYDELLINAAGTGTAHFFDHNRIGINIEYQLLKNLKTEIAYIYISRLPLAGENKLYENNFYLHFSWLMKIKRRT